MKKLFLLPVLIALTVFCSCQKQQTEAERNAEVERQVQERLAAERQAQEHQQLTEAQAKLEQTEKELADAKAGADQAPSTNPTPAERQRRRTEPVEEETGSYSTFYTKLEPHGEWRETSTYGYVWQPREAQSRNWRPYTNGRWVYTDAGWTWVSEEPFGWATYHYGRWTRLRNIGWVWVPGDEWAPAWVSWRKSNDYVGWAPLPPEARFDRRAGIHNWADNYYDIGPDQYSFVPTNQFGSQRTERTIVPADRNVTIINQTTNVTNITYNNTTVVNQGPDFEELRSRTQEPIQRLRLQREVNVNINVNGEAPRPVVRGEVVVVPAPLIMRGRTVERPRTVKETLTEVAVDYGWEAISDRSAAEKARHKMRSESTPPPDAPSRTFVKPAEGGAPSATAASTPAPASSVSSATVQPTAPVRSTATPAPPSSPAASVSPVSPAAATPSARPRGSARPNPAMSPSPGANARPSEPAQILPRPMLSPRAAGPNAAETSSVTPRPTFSPRKPAEPAPSSSVSSTPEVSPTPSTSASLEPPTTYGKKRSIRKQLQEQGSIPKEDMSPPDPVSAPDGKPRRQLNRPLPPAGPAPEATPPPAAAATPSPSASSPTLSSSFARDREKITKEEKKKRKAERAAERDETASPSPSAIPQ